MFSFKSVSHFFASVAHDVKVGVSFLATHQAQIGAGLATGVAIVSAVDPALAPIATMIERGSEAALGEVLAVVSRLGDAAGAQGASITLDAAVVAEFKALIAAIEKLKPGTIATATALHATLPTAA